MATEGSLRGTQETLDEIDLRDLLAVIFKWRWLIVGITALSVLTAALVSFFVLPPVYEAKMTLMVLRVGEERSQPAGEDLEELVSPFAALPQRTIDTYIAHLTSLELLQRVVEGLRLNPQVYRPETLAGMITARNLPRTNLIEVTVAHTDPVLARQVAEELAKQFLASLEEQNRTQLARSVVLLEQQLADVQAQLAEARQRLHALRSRPRGAQVVNQELQVSLEMLSDLRAELATNSVEIVSAEAMVAELEHQLAQTPATLTRTEVVERPDGSRDTVTVTESNPTYVQLDAQLRSQRAALARLRGAGHALESRISELQQQIAQLQAELSSVQSEEQAAAAQVATLEQTEQLLREKMAETQILQSLDLAGTSVLVTSPPRTPTSPVRPRKMLNMAVAGVLGGMLSMFLAFVLNAFDTTVKRPEDIEELLGVPVIGQVPDFARMKVST